MSMHSASGCLEVCRMQISRECSCTYRSEILPTEAVTVFQTHVLSVLYVCSYCLRRVRIMGLRRVGEEAEIFFFIIIIFFFWWWVFSFLCQIAWGSHLFILNCHFQPASIRKLAECATMYFLSLNILFLNYLLFKVIWTSHTILLLSSLFIMPSTFVQMCLCSGHWLRLI